MIYSYLHINSYSSILAPILASSDYQRLCLARRLLCILAATQFILHAHETLIGLG